MTQKSVFLDFRIHCLFERVNVVDSLSRKSSLFEKVLVDIRNGEGVRVHSARAGENSLEKRAIPIGRQRGCDAGLHDGIAVDNSPVASAEYWLIEGMRHRPNQARDRASGHSRIRIER